MPSDAAQWLWSVMGLGSSRAGDQDTVLWVDGCFCGPRPKCKAIEHNWARTKGEPTHSLNNQLCTCSQQLRAFSSTQEKSYLKVNQPVKGGRVSVDGCPSVHPAPFIPHHTNSLREICTSLCWDDQLSHSGVWSHMRRGWKQVKHSHVIHYDYCLN